MSKRSLLWIFVSTIVSISASPASGADRLLGVQSARVMSQSMPWIAQETGIFRKYNLEFPLVYIGSSPLATAAMLGGDAQMMIDGGLGTVRAVVQGNSELVFIAGIKNYLTQSILAKPEIKRLEDLRGKKVGVTRIGATTHYFAVQAFKRRSMEAGRDYVMIQTGGAPEMLAALLSGAIEAGTMTAPWDTRAIAEGFHYVVFGPDLRLPQVAVSFITRRSLIARSSPLIAQFMRAMAEAAKILHTDKEVTFKVLGKYLRVEDRKILEAGYNAEIKALEPKMELKLEALQAILDDVALVDPHAKQIKAVELYDRRFLDEMEKSGFFEKLWSGTANR
ncbi:MAG: ABC transporter substrate-binding protein [Deltaproteobacteria bacterium]|nr:ABC transporter substrate-binding protein [Deltaproteobacteria bacterium]